MIYHEEGWVAEVEVVSREPKKMGETEGEEVTLKVIKTLRESPIIKKECLPQDGAVFSVWSQEKNGGAYGWALTEY
jgi:hypothetical protein